MLNYWLPKDSQIGGNLYYKDPNVKQATENVSDKYYTLEGVALKSRTSNYKILGYDKFCHESEDGQKLHISIKDIVMERLKDLKIETILNDTRCTFESEELGSLRAKRDKSNTMIIW